MSEDIDKKATLLGVVVLFSFLSGFLIGDGNWFFGVALFFVAVTFAYGAWLVWEKTLKRA